MHVLPWPFIHFQEPMEHVIQSLVKFLEVNDEGIVACAAGILANLTCNNQDNKMSVYKNAGVQALMNALVKCFRKDEVAEPIVSRFWFSVNWV